MSDVDEHTGLTHAQRNGLYDYDADDAFIAANLASYREFGATSTGDVDEEETGPDATNHVEVSAIDFQPPPGVFDALAPILDPLARPGPSDRLIPAYLDALAVVQHLAVAPVVGGL